MLMKTLKLLLLSIITGVTFISCEIMSDEMYYNNTLSLEEIITDYDLWYIDYHRTTGTGDVPFLSKAFTISFINGRLYANNNIVDIGRTGNGLGIEVGTYNTRNGYLEITHDLDGRFDFDVYEISANEIEIRDNFNHVTYYLIGYQRNNFDYDKLFYENIEYFLQEYIAWEKTEANGGTANAFDNEIYLQFTPENITTFYSSQDINGTNIDIINWDFVGEYKIYDVAGYENLKILTLFYDGGDVEEFELSVINDQRIMLYHLNSGTEYYFSGRGFIQYIKGDNTKPNVRNNGRKRIKVKREVKRRRNLK